MNKEGGVEKQEVKNSYQEIGDTFNEEKTVEDTEG